jgi:hypothetical protein
VANFRVARSARSLSLAVVGALAVGIALDGDAVQSGAVSPAVAARRVKIVTPDADDPRVPWVHDAIAFWRDTFAELGLEPALVGAGLVVAPPGERAMENFAWQISRAAGRLPDGVAGPPPPPELLALDGDVVVLLSSQRLMPFARPFLPDSGRYLVAIPAVRREAQPAGVARNVIAHELGHSLGLRHGEDPASLMCEPCPGATVEGDGTFRPLTNKDRARLVELYGSRQ